MEAASYEAEALPLDVIGELIPYISVKSMAKCAKIQKRCIYRSTHFHPKLILFFVLS
jgi:hypothetical protein